MFLELPEFALHTMLVLVDSWFTQVTSYRLILFKMQDILMLNILMINKYPEKGLSGRPILTFLTNYKVLTWNEELCSTVLLILPKSL